MWQEIFNKNNYSFNPYAIPDIAIASYSLVLGIFVLVKKKWEGISLLLTASSISMWLFTIALMYLSANASTGYLWTKICYFPGVCFISVSTYFFSLVVTGKINNRNEKRLLYFGYFIMTVFAFFSIFTDLFVKYPPRKFPWGYYPNPALLYHIFLPLWIFFVFKTTYTFYKSYREETNALEKKRNKIFFYSYLLGYIGSFDYFGVYGIKVYPFGYIFVSVWVSLFVYNFIKYKAFGIDTVIHKTLLWLATSLWLLIPGYFLFKYTRHFLQSLTTLWLTISALGLFYLFLWYYRYFQPKIDHLFRRRKYDYQAILAKIAEKVATTINIEELTRKLLSEVCETMYLRNSLLYVSSKQGNKYVLIGRRGYKEINGIRQRAVLELFNDTSCELKDAHPLYKLITQEREILEKEQIEINPRYKDIREEAVSWLGKQEIELIVPLVLENKVNAILGLGRKDNLKAYTLKDIKLLKKLGEETGVTLYNALHYKDLLEKDRLEEEMRLGRDIQTALLPKTPPQITNLAICGLMLPAKEIGGDYYDFILVKSPQSTDQSKAEQTTEEDSLAIVIGDVSGKGVGAGIIMAAAKATLKGLSQHELSPKQILCRTNNLLYEYTSGQKFMTMLYLNWDSSSKTLNYSSAGHEHILIYRAQGTRAQGHKEVSDSSLRRAAGDEAIPGAGHVESILSGGFMLGMLEDIEAYLEEHSITLNPKDKVLLYTDGVTEAEDTKGERFGLERLIESFKRHSQKPPQELILSIKDEVYSFMGSQPQYDDITLVGMEAE